MQLIYLHGFASSPESSKAVFLRERLAAIGVRLHCPDLNQPEFATMTTTRMIEQVESLMGTLDPGPVALLGSSLGGFVAAHVAERDRERRASGAEVRTPVERLVMLAPALDFGRRGMTGLTVAELEAWRERGVLEIEHYGTGERVELCYDLYADAQRYDSFAIETMVPTLILQGSRDDIVDPAMVQRFAAGRSRVDLVLLADDHQLKTDLDRLWVEVTTFLGLPQASN